MSNAILIVAVVAVYGTSLFFIERIFRRFNILTEQTLLRSSPIDAVRGLLATSVVCHHFIVTYYWKVNGVWDRPKSDLLNNMGAVPVSLFFMITGFLFFGKIYKKNPDWGDILRSRIQRVMPLYVFVVFMVFMISLMKAGFVIDADPKGLLKGLVSWGLFVGSSFNGVSDSVHMTSGAHWTLRYEWLFYLSLPIVATVVNAKWYGKYLILSMLVMVLAIPGVYVGLVVPKMALLFFIGFAPVIMKMYLPSFLPLIKNRVCSLVVLVSIVCGMFISQQYSIVQMLVLGVPFIIIALGNDVFGVLSSRGLKALGEVSYSVYLTHGLILYLLFSVFEVFSFDGGSVFQYIALLPVVLALVSVCSVMTFFVIEKPFIRVGNKKVPVLS